jgi:hypothetical protein
VDARRASSATDLSTGMRFGAVPPVLLPVAAASAAPAAELGGSDDGAPEPAVTRFAAALAGERGAALAGAGATLDVAGRLLVFGGSAALAGVAVLEAAALTSSSRLGPCPEAGEGCVCASAVR